MKTVTQRVTESLEIRQGIRRLGIEVLDSVRADIAATFNDYVKNGTNVTKRYKFDSKVIIVVTLNSNDNAESGITLERFE